MAVTPANATLSAGATQTFSATVTNDTTNAGVTWSASAGTISAAGIYTAPTPVTTPTASVTATSKADSSKTATATVTLTPISVSINPMAATLVGGATQTFAATVTGDSTLNQGVTWTASAGTITSAGVYTAPSPITSPTATVTAASKTDPSKAATATVTLTAIGVSLTSSNAITLDAGQTLAISASVTGDNNASGATFSVSGAGGSMSASLVSGNSPTSTYTAPAVSSTATATVTVASVADPSKTQTVAITLNPSMSFTPSAGALAMGTTGAAYAGATLAVSGGSGTKTFSIAGGSLPAGLTMSSSGVISGTPTGAFGTSNFSVQVADQSGNPTPISGGFSIAIGAPQLQSVSPSSIPTGSTNTTVRLTGLGFGPTTTIYLNGLSVSTTYVSNQSVSFILGPQSYTGSLTVYVRNGSYNSGTLTIPIVNAVPTLTSISPASVIAGAPSFQLTLTGTNISSVTTVLINGVQHTFFTSTPTSVTVTVNSSEVATVGNLAVTLVNPAPGGGSSSPVQLQIIGADNRLRTLNYATQDIITDPVRNLLYASVSSGSPTSPNSVVAIDPLQGTVVTTQSMSAQPGQLAVSDDGSYLYVVVGTTGQVSRLLLPTLAPDIQWSVGSTSPMDIEVAPGSPHTIAVTGGQGGITNGLRIFDDGVARSLTATTTYSSSYDTIAWGNDAGTLYATMAVTSGGPEYVFSVNQNGPTLTNTIPSVFGSFDKRLIYDKTSGLIYDGYGRVANAASGASVGQFNVQNTLSYEQNAFTISSAAGRAFFLNENSTIQSGLGFLEDIQAFDATNYSYLNAIEIPNLSGGRIVHWGTSGLAVGGGSQIYLVDGPFVSSAGVSSAIGGYVATSPTLNSILPITVPAGSPDLTITLTGKNFSQAAVVTWNSQTLQSAWQSSTQITATIPASMLAQALTSSVQVSNGPGTENSEGYPFTVLPDLGANLQISALPVSGEDMAVDPVRGLLYVAVTNPAAPNGNSIAVVDPAASAIQSVVPMGNQPWSLGVSDDGKYLYAGFETLASVKRLLLPALSLDLAIPLSSGGGVSESYAGEVKVAPGQNQTIAVTMGSPVIEPRSAGGIGIFDGATERPKAIPYGGNDLFKLTWGKDATKIFANSDPVFQPQGAAILSVDSTGIVSTSGFAGGEGYIGLRSHYDSGTNLVYSDGGNITSLDTATSPGTLKADGPMVPDSTLNRAFFVQRDATLGGGYYDIVIFDLRTQTLLKTIPITKLAGAPTQLVRWGSQGLAILTDSYGTGYGMLYILQGSDISGLSAPPPGAITLNPSSVVEGTAVGATVTVAGSNFSSNSIVEVNGSSRATAFISATQLSFQLTAADQAFPTYLTVIVSNPGGATSPAASLAIGNPAPAISALGSATVLVGSSTTITVQGSGFVPASVVQWNGTPRSTTYVSSTQLTATPNYNDFSATGKYPITVVNPAPGGGVSNAVLLEVDNPVPAITSVLPNTIATGSASRSVNVYGSGFLPSTVVQVNGTPRTTTYSSSAQVSVALTTADFATAGNLSVVAVNPAPGGGNSAAATLAVASGLLGPIALNPNVVLTGTTTPTTITVTGSNFTASTYVQLNGTNRTTTFINPTQLSFQLTVADQATAGNFNVLVLNPNPNGSVVGATLTVAAPTATPVISSISPSQLVVGSTGSTLELGGTGFTSTSVVLWNGTPLTGSSTFSGFILASVPASLLSAAGTASITVNNPTATPSLSNAVSISIVNPPVPTLTSMTPTSGPINLPLTATFTGTGFTGNSVVAINGTAVPTTFVGSTQLTAAVPAAEVVPGNLSFTVTTPSPGGGTSSAVNFTGYIPIVNNSMIYNPVSGLFYLSIPSSAGAPYANSIVALDPVTGAMGTPIFVGSEPNRLALTSDGRYLWVGLDGAHAVRKVDLVAGSAGLQFSIPPCTNCVNTPAWNALALAALPGQTDSVIVSGGSSQGAYSMLGIFDSGVLRGNLVTLFSPGILSLQVDGSRNEIYQGGGGSAGIYTYSASGLTAKTSVSSPWQVSYDDDRIQLASGRIYTDFATVYDSETASLLGNFAIPANYSSYPAPVAIDSTLGLAFVLDASVTYSQLPNQIQIFNLTNFTQSGTTAIPVNLATNSFGEPVSPPYGLVRWGTNGLAFRNSVSVYALRSNLVQDLSATPADLSVSLATSGPNTTGAQTTYTATVSNAGPSSATETSFSAALPSTGVLVSATPSAGSCSTSAAVTCDLGTLSSGITATVTLVVNQLTPGTASMTVMASSSQADPNPTNNQSTSSITITGSTYTAAPTLLSITPSTVLAGSTDTAITVAGTGFGPGTNVQLDGTALQTNVVSSSQLSATVPAASLATLGWHAVTVSNPSPGGGISAPQPLSIYSVLKAGVNHILYEPFSRQILATMGSSMPQGNSVETLVPSTGVFSTPVYVGSEPTRMALSDDGQVVYVLATGSGQIVQYNLATQQPQSSFVLNNSNINFAVQPGTENTLAVTGNYNPQVEIVDFDPVNHTAAARPENSGNSPGASPQFLNASNVAVSGASVEQFALYPVTSNGVSATPNSYAPGGFGPFKLAQGIAYSTSGTVTDISAGSLLGTFPFNVGSSYAEAEAAVAPDPALGKVFYLGGLNGTGYSSINSSGIAAFDTSSFELSGAIPLNISAIENSTSTPMDVIRWGQDGIAALTSAGNIYLIRGAAVLPQLLQTNGPPVLSASLPSSLQHGSGNTVLTLSGTNFLPGAAVTWSGSYRTTNWISATQVTVDIPASDLISAGTASIAASNPGSASSATITLNIN